MKKLKDFIFPALFLSGIAMFALAGRAPATGADYTLDRQPEVIAATFSSAWCSACKILEPKLADIVPDFADKPVKFVKLNFTFGEGDDQKSIALENAFSDAYERFKGGTGFTLLIDAQTGEVMDMLTMNHPKPAMRAMIAQSLALAERQNGDQ